VLDIGSMPWPASCFFMSGSAITLAISALRRATISFGVAAGASTPSQIDTSKPVRPDSASVGTFGAAGERFGLVTPQDVDVLNQQVTRLNGTLKLLERELTLTRLIDALPEKLFRCWTEPKLIVQWFTPPPFETIFANLTGTRSMDAPASHRDCPNHG